MTQHLFRAIAFLGVMVACTVNVAQAGFVNQIAQSTPDSSASGVKVNPLPEQAQSHGSKLTPRKNNAALMSAEKLVQIGRRPSHVAVVVGQGRDTDLSDMLSVIIPKDFKLDATTLGDQPNVSWHGGRPWDQVLLDALTPLPDVAVMIDWQAHEVALRSISHSVGSAMPDQKAALLQANAMTVPGSVVSSPVPVIAMHATPIRWEVKVSDVTLRETLTRWAKTAGWQVSWEIPYDYPVQLDAVFTGSFEDVVTQFMTSLRNSDYPPLGCLYEANRVVRVLHYGDKQECSN